MERGEYEIIDPQTGVTNSVKMTAEEAVRCTIDLGFAQEIISRQAYENSMNVASATDLTDTTAATVSETTAVEATRETQPSENLIYRWRESNIYLLLDVYEEIQEKFADPNVSQKKAWHMVAEEMNKRTPDCKVTGPQCMTKIRSLKKVYKNVKDHNSKSGNDRRTWKYFDRLNEIFAMRAWATPLSLVTSEPDVNEPTPSTSSTRNSQSETCTSAPTGTRENRNGILQMLELKLEQRERHEAACQQRHEERLASDQALIQTLRDFMASGQ